MGLHLGTVHGTAVFALRLGPVEGDIRLVVKALEVTAHLQRKGHPHRAGDLQPAVAGQIKARHLLAKVLHLIDHPLAVGDAGEQHYELVAAKAPDDAAGGKGRLQQLARWRSVTPVSSTMNSSPPKRPTMLPAAKVDCSSLPTSPST